MATKLQIERFEVPKIHVNYLYGPRGEVLYTKKDKVGFQAPSKKEK